MRAGRRASSPRDGKQHTIALLGPGDAFGEIGIVDRQAQDLYVEALDEVVVCRTTRDAFLRLCSRDPALALRLAEAMGEKLQEARERIADFSPSVMSVAGSPTSS